MSAEETIRAYLDKRITRRDFMERLQKVGVTAGAAFAYAELLESCTGLAGSGAGAVPMALTPAELVTLEAISGRILPTTDTPGAVEAGAVFYIDQALAGAYRAQLPRYQRALAEIDAHCTAQFGKAFAGLAPAQQDAVLEALEGGKIKEVEGGPQIFETMRRHIMEGVFCEPIYGGNRGLVGWQLVGFPGQRWGYDDPYINKRIDLPPVAQDGMPRKGI